MKSSTTFSKCIVSGFVTSISERNDFNNKPKVGSKTETKMAEHVTYPKRPFELLIQAGMLIEAGMLKHQLIC